MQNLLGIFSKKAIPNSNDFFAILEDFSLYGKRDVRVKINGHFLLAFFDPCGVENYPMHISADKTKIMFFGGHIYNLEKIAKEIANTNNLNPTEITQIFNINPEKFLSDCNGVFSLVYYNNIENEIIIANDAFGLYPLFIYEDDNYLIFSNEFEPILFYKNFDDTLDKDAIAEYFALGSPLVGRTFFKKIYNLNPASILKLSSTRKSQNRYYTPNIEINHTGNIDFYAKQIAEVFHEAVQFRASLTGKMSCMLTGGLDTRFILSNLSKEQRDKMDFITFITPGLDPENDKDVIIAKKIAEKLSLNHKVFEYKPWSVQWKEDFDLKFFDIWREQYPEMTFAGVFGGEFLNGGCFDIIPKQSFSASKVSRFNWVFFRNNEKIINSIEPLYKGFLHNLKNPFETLNEEIKKINTESKILCFTFEYMTRGFFTQIYGGIRAKWADPYTFPTRMMTPFLDKEYLKVLLSIPVSILTDEKQALYNTIYKKHLPELNNIPTSNISFANTKSNCIKFLGEGNEPRNSRPFMNEKALDNYIKDTATWEKKFYNKKSIMSFSSESNAKELRSFFDFEAWYRKYVR